MAGKSVAIDPGSHSIKVLALKDGKNGLAVTGFAVVPAPQKAQGLADTGIPLKDVVAGIAGRDMTLRYTQVPPSPDWQLRNLMELEIADLASQSGDALSADYNLLPPTGAEADSDTVLMALARNEALDRVAEMVGEAGGNVAAHVPNCIAVYNAYLRSYPTDEEQVVCIANIGHETVDIALAKGQDLLFARNLSGGGKVLDEAIASSFNVSPRKAESLKRELLDLDPASRGRFASGQAEKVTMAAGGSSSMLVSAIQSSVAFCKSQTKQADLTLDLVLLCGGSARLRGIRGLLRESLRCPVELFDPFQSVDLSALAPDALEELERHRSEAVAALGLAASGLDATLYSLEILPESVKRRQRFVQRTVFNIAAALILVGLLAYQAFTATRDAEAAAAAKRRADALKRQAAATHKQTEELVAKNQLTHALVTDLHRRSVPLDGTLRVMRVLQETLPEDMWLDKIEVQTKKTGAIADRHPVIEVEGRGKEVTGKAIAEVSGSFVAALKARPEELGQVTPSQENKSQGITFELTFDPLAGPAAGTPADQEGEK